MGTCTHMYVYTYTYTCTTDRPSLDGSRKSLFHQLLYHYFKINELSATRTFNRI
jgi:hypothetical protein